MSSTTFQESIRREIKSLKTSTSGEGPTALVVIYVRMKTELIEAIQKTPDTAVYGQALSVLNEFGVDQVSHMLDCYMTVRVEDYAQEFYRLKATIQSAEDLLASLLVYE